jgi:hypothetical protein
MPRRECCGLLLRRLAVVLAESAAAYEAYLELLPCRQSRATSGSTASGRASIIRGTAAAIHAATACGAPTCSAASLPGSRQPSCRLAPTPATKRRCRVAVRHGLRCTSTADRHGRRFACALWSKGWPPSPPPSATEHWGGYGRRNRRGGTDGGARCFQEGGGSTARSGPHGEGSASGGGGGGGAVNVANT